MDVSFQNEYVANISATYLQIEEEILLEELKKCNKSALILERDGILKYSAKLTTLSSIASLPGRVHVGKEKYFEQYFSFFS